MRLAEELPTRAPWQTDELRRLFGSPVFTQSLRPAGGRGEAAFWLPLLGLFTGARLGELAPLTTADVTTDASTGIATITIKEDIEQGRTLKTLASRRVVPVHPELVRVGFLHFADSMRAKEEMEARLFPLLTPGSRGVLGQGWSKWFGSYIRGIGVTNTDSVFHSFRHSFKDALRAVGVGEDVNDALLGHVGPGTVARRYGAKEMVRALDCSSSLTPSQGQATPAWTCHTCTASAEKPNPYSTPPIPTTPHRLPARPCGHDCSNASN
jgi:integrase